MEGIVLGPDVGMRCLWDTLVQVAQMDVTVLLQGETGTGKERLARALHRASRRRAGPFVAVHCAALAAGLLDSELFGHEPGAFPGAEHRHLGQFERARRGTLFLDEISTLPLTAQGKLLQALQDHTVERLGGETRLPVDVRVVAATNEDLAPRVAQGTFRRELFSRLYVVPLPLPPLRERRADIPPLVTHFLAKYNAEHGRQIAGLTAEALTLLCAYDWPGNVRELENCLNRLVALNRVPLLTATEVREAFAMDAPAATALASPDGHGVSDDRTHHVDPVPPRHHGRRRPRRRAVMPTA
jgi:DNA-binding NtrC family response regulator